MLGTSHSSVRVSDGDVRPGATVVSFVRRRLVRQPFRAGAGLVVGGDGAGVVGDGHGAGAVAVHVDRRRGRGVVGERRLRGVVGRALIRRGGGVRLSVGRDGGLFLGDVVVVIQGE